LAVAGTIAVAGRACGGEARYGAAFGTVPGCRVVVTDCGVTFETSGIADGD
jgi:hypothetical protein